METIAIYIGYMIIYLLEVIICLLLISFIYKILDFLYGRFAELGNIIMMYNKMSEEDKEKVEELFLKY